MSTERRTSARRLRLPRPHLPPRLRRLSPRALGVRQLLQRQFLRRIRLAAPTFGAGNLRRRRLAIRVGAVSLASALGAWIVAWSPFFDVDRVEVSGLSRISRGEALSASGVGLGPALLRVDVDSARQGLEGVPWVARAAISRHLPGTVRISVVEREPLATVARAGGGLALIDGSGRVLVDTGERPEGLPHVPGAPEPPAPGGFLTGDRQPLAAVAALSAELRRMVDTAEEVAGLLVLRLRNGTEVRLGGPSELRGKAAALEAVLASLGDRRVSYVDVRVPTAPAVGSIPEKG